MAWFDYLWLEGDAGNIEHLAEHGLTPEDIEHVMEGFTAEGSKSKQRAPRTLRLHA